MRSREWTRLQRALLAGVLLAFAMATVTGGGGAVSAGLVSNVLLIALPLAATLCCFSRAVIEEAGRRRPWVLIGAAVLSWGLGQSVWTWYEQVLGRTVPFPSFADVGYLAAIPLLLAGLLLMPYAQLPVATRLRMLLDGFVIGVAILLVSWQVVLQPMLAAADSGWLVTIISLAYPVGDSVAIILALVIVARARHGSELRVLTLLTLAAGTVAFAVGDTGFLLLTQADAYHSGHPVDLGWAAGFTLIAVAATIGGSSTESTVPGHTRRLGLLAPYAAVVVAVVAAAARLAQTGGLGAFTLWLLFAELMLVVTRQVLTMFENDSLTRTLEQRVTDRTEQLASRERWFGSLVRNSSDVILVLDSVGVIDFQTPSVQRVLGYPAGGLAGTPLSELIAAEDRARVAAVLLTLGTQPQATTTMDIAMCHRDGGLRHTETTVTSLVHDPAVNGFVVTIRDVTERRRLEQQLIHQAFHDELTGLANKALFSDRLSRALAACARTAAPLAVIFIDLDSFKSVNDSLGHGSGDELLSQVAQRLTSCVRAGDTVARFGGDEFAVLLESMRSEDEALDLARRFRSALQSAFPVGGREVLVRASMGVAVNRTGREDAEELLRNADLAMYRAKAKREGGYQIYETAMHTSALTRLELENDLRRALRRGEFHLEYQPIIELHSGRITGVEALLRWTHPERGNVPPLDFITVAEDIGLIGEIGAWVIEEACHQAGLWRPLYQEAFSVAINISGRQFTPDLIDQIRDALARHDVAPSTLTLEMTESVLINHTHDVLDLLGELRNMGVKIAIDDFGTGYSSLSYLSRLPVDILKLDRSFVEQVATGTQETELTKTIVALAQTLQLTTVAEGIEQNDQLGELLNMGCSHGQGFLFSHSVPADVIATMLRKAAGQPQQMVTHPARG
jgi:diguanylate cyclase (GGDEF)-like protein/PAS domain S-box-containing protein